MEPLLCAPLVLLVETCILDAGIYKYFLYISKHNFKTERRVFVGNPASYLSW
jgi:hypothetical protein